MSIRVRHQIMFVVEQADINLSVFARKTTNPANPSRCLKAFFQVKFVFVASVVLERDRGH